MKIQSIFSIIICLLIVAILTNCAYQPGSVVITPDGHILSSHTDAATGKTFLYGVGFGEDGKVDRATTQWVNADGTSVRAVRHMKRNVTEFFYQDSTGTWIKWSSKSGVTIGGQPAAPPVNTPTFVELPPVARSSK